MITAWITTKNSPVISSVMASVSSMRCQFDASGCVHHGLRRWNSTEPATMTIRAMGRAMAGSRTQGRQPALRRWAQGASCRAKCQ